MQLAKVSVWQKKGNEIDLTNFRPVSILPFFSKGFEKMVLTRITTFSKEWLPEILINGNGTARTKRIYPAIA